MTAPTGTLYPRALVGLSAALAGEREQVDTAIIPTRVSLVRRSHNQAGTCEVTLGGAALPFDPRHIEGVFVEVFLGATPTVADLVQRPEYLRFVGYVDELHPTHDASGTTVTLKARDLSALFRDHKPLPRAALPRYSDTLGDAIRRILRAVPATAGARVGLRGAPDDAVLARPLAAAAPARAAGAAVQLPADATAWQAIEHVCGLLALLVSVDLHDVVVRLDAQASGRGDAPATEFVFGGGARANVLSVEATKKFVRNRRGVKVTGFDVATRARVEAVWPPDGELGTIRRPRARLGGAALAAPRRSARAAAPPERDVFPAPPGVSAPEALEAHARRIYDERSRQEVEGRIVAPWIERDATNALLALQNADRVTLRVRPDLEDEARHGDPARAARLLVSRLGVSPEAAVALVRAARRRPSDAWYARTVTHEFATEGVSKTTVEYINLIDLRDGVAADDAGAEPAAGTRGGRGA